MADRSEYPLAAYRLGEAPAGGSDGVYAALTPSERFALVWDLTVQAWAFRDPTASERRLRRDVVRIVRGRG
jgi:hypothetical protein